MTAAPPPQYERNFDWRGSLLDALDKVASSRDTTIEESLIGCLILDPNAVDEVSAELRSTDFWDSDLGAVYDVICVQHDMKRPVSDVRLLMAALKLYGVKGKDGQGVTRAEITKWIHSSPGNSAHVKYYAHEILKLSQIRDQLTAVMRSIDGLVEGREDPRSSADRLIARVEAISARTSIEITSIGDAAMRAVAEIEAKSKEERIGGVSTSLQSLDEMLGGFFPNELIIIAARPSGGKTALAMQACHSAAIEGRNVLFVSLEMLDKELATRICCAISGVDNQLIRSGNIRQGEIVKLYGAAEALKPLNLHIYETKRGTLKMIRAAIKAAMNRGKLDMVCVDYLQLIEARDNRMLRSEQVAEFTRELKAMAKEFAVPMVVLCQLNRGAESDLPTMAHLKDSGSIEQDADVIVAIHRGEEEAGKGLAKLIVLKNRNGPRGTVECGWRPEATKFEDPEVRYM